MWGVPPCWGVGLGGRNPPAKFTCCSGSGQRHSSRWPQFPLEDSVVFAVCGNRVKIKCAVSTRQTPKHSSHARPSGEAASVRTARPAAGRGWLRAPGASPTGGRRGGRPEESQPARSPQTPHHPARSSLDHQLSVGTAPSSEGLAAPLRVRMKAKARVPLGSAGPRGVSRSCPRGTRRTLGPGPRLSGLSPPPPPLLTGGQGAAPSWGPILRSPYRGRTPSPASAGTTLLLRARQRYVVGPACPVPFTRVHRTWGPWTPPAASSELMWKEPEHQTSLPRAGPEPRPRLPHRAVAAPPVTGHSPTRAWRELRAARGSGPALAKDTFHKTHSQG